MEPRRRIGPYTLLSPIGAGGMGTVHRAEDASGRPVALKLLHDHLCGDPAFERRFRREVELGARIRDPRVVGTLGGGTFDREGARGPGYYIAMEFVEGQTLRDLIRADAPLPEALCLHLAREVCAALRAIHAAGVVHRDLKPENILVTADHAVKVGDLGIARSLRSTVASEGSAFAGTVLYAAPEQFGEGEVDGSADLYALGLILCEMGTGAHPFAGEDAVAIMRRHLEAVPRAPSESNPGLSAFYDAVVATLTGKRREDRFPSAGALLDALEGREASRWWRETGRGRAPRGARRHVAPRETPLVGRAGEMAALHAAFADAASGDGRLVLVEGEAGIGKSRLCEEFLDLLAARGEVFHDLRGSYAPGSGATGSGAFSTAYREHLGPEGLEDAVRGRLGTMERLAPAFAALLRGEPPPPGAEPLSRESMQAVFVRVTRSLAAERPVVLLLEDVHLAPVEAHALVLAMAPALRRERVLLLLTARPGGLEEWTLALGRAGDLRRLAPARLGAKDLARLLGEAFGSEHLAEDLSYMIATRSDGNPFFALEIVRGLREQGALARREDGSWRRTRVIDAIGVPSSVRELVLGRLAGLEPQDKDLLDLAACCGHEFDPLLVAEASGRGVLPALQRLGWIERRHRLVRSAGRCCVFDHHQVRETIYEGLMAPLREQYHLLLGGLLERRGPQAAAEICEHFLRGAEPSRARPHLAAAFDRVERGYGAEAPARLARLALAAPGLLEGRDRGLLLLRFAASLELLGRSEEQGRAVDEALALAASLGDEALRLGALVARSRLLYGTGRHREAEPLLADALALARALGDGAAERLVEHSIGTLAMELGRVDESIAHLERARDLFRDAGDRRGEGTAIGNLGNAHLRLRRHAEAEACYRRQLALAEGLGDLRTEGIASGSLGNLALDRGDAEAALALHRRYLATARQTGYRRGAARALASLAIAAKFLGRFGEAEAHYLEACDISREIGSPRGECYSRTNLARLRGLLGEFDDAATLAGAAGATLEGLGDRAAAAFATLVLGEIAEMRGEPEAARGLYERALDGLEPRERATPLRRLAVLTGDRAPLAEALALAREHGVPAEEVLSLAARAETRPEARAALARDGRRIELVARIEALRLLGEEADLAEARDLVARIADHAPPRCRESLRLVPIFRNVAPA